MKIKNFYSIPQQKLSSLDRAVRANFITFHIVNIITIN